MAHEDGSQDGKEAMERFPSKEEVTSVFEKLLQGKQYKEIGARSDSKGLSFYEIEVLLGNGEKEEYNYQRANYDYRNAAPVTARFSASIHVMFYDSNGMPISGKSVANYLDGRWTYT